MQLPYGHLDEKTPRYTAFGESKTVDESVLKLGCAVSRRLLYRQLTSNASNVEYSLSLPAQLPGNKYSRVRSATYCHRRSAWIAQIRYKK